MQNIDNGTILILILTFTAIYFGLVVVIAIFRNLLWKLAFLFQLIDAVMWFLYNPLRIFLRVGYEGRHQSRYRVVYVILNYSLIAPLYRLTIYFLTTPLRIITAFYYDVVMYLVVSTADTIDELLRPKLGAMRFKKGFAYVWRWIVFFPYRLFWFVFKNILAVADSILMFAVSVACPTFTMFHGTSQDAVVNITREGKWKVGPGNFAGSGIYFGRSPKTAKLYAAAQGAHGTEGKTSYPIIVARVTLTMVHNCVTLPQSSRENVGQLGEAGNQLARKVRFPFYATELWRTGTNWWEYSLLQGGKEGQLVKSWRIRPVGYVHINDSGYYSGALQRLWGGKSHYTLHLPSLVMGLISVVMTVGLLVVYGELMGLAA